MCGYTRTLYPITQVELQGNKRHVREEDAASKYRHTGTRCANSREGAAHSAKAREEDAASVSGYSGPLYATSQAGQQGHEWHVREEDASSVCGYTGTKCANSQVPCNRRSLCISARAASSLRPLGGAGSAGVEVFATTCTT